VGRGDSARGNTHGGGVRRGLEPRRDAGTRLAKTLLAGLGEWYDQPIQFIGHSLGAAVNVYAMRVFLEKAVRVSLAQFTALDRPHHVDDIPGAGEDIEHYRFDADSFARVLPVDRPAWICGSTTTTPSTVPPGPRSASGRTAPSTTTPA